LFVVGILIKLPIFTNPPPPPVTDGDSAILYREFVEWLKSTSNNDSLIFSVVTYLFLFTQALQLNSLVNRNRMMQRANFLSAAAYLVITSLMPEWNHFSAPLVINTLVLFIFSGLFNIANQYSIKASVFNMGVAVGISSFIFFPSLVLFFWLIFALMVMRSIKLNEWLICLLGVTTPYYFYAAYLFFSNKWSWENLVQPVEVALPVPGQSLWLAIGGLLLIIPFLLGGYFVQENLRKMLIQVRKNWSVLLLYLLLAFFIPFINSSQSFHAWVLITVPFAAFHACAYFYPIKRWLPLVIFFITIGYVLYQQYGILTWQ